MESLILVGSSAVSGVLTDTLTPGPNLGVQIESIELDIPLDEVGSSDPTITLSGSATGAYSFHSSTSPALKFGYDEVINISTTNLSGEYSATVKYVEYGTQKNWMDTRHRSQIPLPLRLTRNPRDGS